MCYCTEEAAELRRAIAAQEQEAQERDPKTIERKRGILEEYRMRLETGRNEPSLIAYMLRDLPEIKEAGLRDLAWSLASEKWGCHYNDVAGLLDYFEQHIRELEAEASRDLQ